jgi:hypothetical protein
MDLALLMEAIELGESASEEPGEEDCRCDILYRKTIDEERAICNHTQVWPCTIGVP